MVVREEDFAALLAAARDGDRDAISAIWRVEQPRLLRVLRGEVGDAAEDVASQTWLEVMGALRRFEGDERGFRALLFTIARRRVSDHRRTQRRKPSTSTDPEVLHDLVPAHLGEGFDRLGSDEAVRTIVATLNDEQAEVVLLRVVAGLTVGEVAEISGKSEGAVRVLQHRALKRLAALYNGDGSDDL
jgi:RNA polymerase sigma-70 factor (ECF subfamily)